MRPAVVKQAVTAPAHRQTIPSASQTHIQGLSPVWTRSGGVVSPGVLGVGVSAGGVAVGGVSLRSSIVTVA